MWKFDFLRAPKLREMAAREASQAKIVIVAAHREVDLPLPVWDWIDLWTASKRKSLLVLLLDERVPNPRQPDRAASRLRRLASSRGLNFLSLELDYPRGGPGTGISEITPSGEQAMGTLEVLLPSCAPDFPFSAP